MRSSVRHRLRGPGPRPGRAAARGSAPALVIAPLAELRAATLGLWAATTQALAAFADMPARSVVLPLEALALSAAGDPLATDAALLASLEGFAEGQTLCAQALDPRVLPLLSQRGWDLILLPFLRGGWAAPLMQQLRAGPVRPGMSPVILPAPAPGRELLDGAAAVADLVDRMLAQGRPERFSLSMETPVSGLLREILLRAGATLDIGVDEALAAGADSLGHEDLDRALRNDAGWTHVWAQGKALLHRDGAGTAGPAEQPVPVPAGAGLEDPAAGPPQAGPEAVPTLGFCRLGPEDTLLGSEAYFAQLRFYRPENLGFEALDAQFQNLRLGRSAIRRLSLRFFFEGAAVRLFLRGNDCSADAFTDPESRWQQDDWGPFVIYRIDTALTSAYGEGLAGADLDALTEALNLIRALDDQIRPRLSGQALDDWGRIAQALRSCALAGG